MPPLLDMLSLDEAGFNLRSRPLSSVQAMRFMRNCDHAGNAAMTVNSCGEILSSSL